MPRGSRKGRDNPHGNFSYSRDTKLSALLTFDNPTSWQLSSVAGQDEAA